MMKLFLKKVSTLNLSNFLRNCLLLAVFSIALGASYWIFFIPSYYFMIPVQIDTTWNLPLIQTKIGNKKYEFELDLGARLSALSQTDLNEIDKEFCETSSCFDMHGNIYESAVYQISEIKIHDFFLPKMKVEEESPEFLANSVLKGDKNTLPYTGRLGREVFEGKNFLLDFPQSKIILCKNFKDLTKDRYNLEDFIKTSFFLDKKIGICLQIETDAGLKIFLLDSGASISFIRLPDVDTGLSTGICHGFPVWHTKKFAVGDHDFGERKLYLFKISSLYSDINGFLGMDFLKEHAIYLDMEHSVAYIAKCSTAAR